MTSFFHNHYPACVGDYWSRLDRQKIVQFYESNARIFGLHDGEQVISFGLGNGSYDASIIKNCMPSVVSYTGVDPGDYVAEVEDNLLKVQPELQVKTYKLPAQVWAKEDGPSEPVDVIFCLEMLKHLPDKRNFLKQCWDWLAPGGALIIQTWDEKTVFNDFQKEVLEGDTKDMAEAGKYWPSHIRKDLEMLNLPIQEFEVDTILNLDNITKEFVTYLFWRDPTDAEMQKTMTWLNEYRVRESKDGVYHYNTIVFVMVKP